LDHENRSRLIDTVSAICQATGAQVFFVTHRRNEFPSCITHVLEFSRNPEDQGPYQHKMIEL
jgi:ABC-type molybdenum transport system ATPase subunit/photorepair protein PhrA